MKHSLRILVWVLWRECLLAVRKRGEIFQPLLFFVIVVSLFPLAIGPDNNLLRQVGPGVIWVAALLAMLLNADNLLRSDHDDGSILLLVMNDQPLSLLLLAKVFAHWVLSGLPLLILAPVLGIIMHLDFHAILILCVSLLLGTPILSLLGGIGLGLTLGLRNHGILLALLILPLYVPVLIFGSGSVLLAASGMPVAGFLEILGALLILAVSLAPLALAAAVRVGLMEG